MKKWEAEDFCRDSYCHSQPCGLWDPGERLSGHMRNVCRQQGRLPRSFRQCSHLGFSSHFLLHPPSVRELGVQEEAAGTAGQGKERSCRINSKTLPWRAGKDNKDACYLERTVKIVPVKPASLGVIGQRPAVPGLSLVRA